MSIPLRQYWNLLVKYLRPIWSLTILLTVLLFTSIGLQLINPQIMRRFIDLAQSRAPEVLLVQNAVLFLGIALAQQVLSILATYTGENVGWTATNALRLDLARHCLTLDMSFHNVHTPGEMIERIDGDVTVMSNFFSQFIVQLLGNFLLLVGVLVFLFAADWRVGAGLTLFVIFSLIILYRLENIAVPYWEAERQSSADLFGFLEERLMGTEDIRSNGAKAYGMQRFFILMREQMKRSIRAGWMVNILVNSSEILFTIGLLVAFMIGAYLFRGSVISIGTVYIIFNYSTMLMGPIQRLTQQVQDLQKAGASIIRVQNLFKIQSRIEDRGILDREDRTPGVSTFKLPQGALAIAFDQVSFSYHDAPDSDGLAPGMPPVNGLDENGKKLSTGLVLKNISFDLEPGMVLGLLGRTGSGKTSLTKLLFRLYDVDRGKIYLGDRRKCEEIRNISIDSLKRRVGMVTQNIQLFHASIRNNLTFFDPTISDDQIVRVIEDLGLGRWFQSLPNGLDSELQAGGAGLSAGEAQLLAFTRIFLRDPGLVILDEASSRLDPATEQLIEHAVERLVKNRTAIIIAHRLHTIQRADKIMILEGGQIIEYGPRAALASDPRSHFAALLQTGLEEVLA